MDVEKGRCETAERATAPTPRWTGPTSRPTSTEPTRNTAPATNGSIRGPGGGRALPLGALRPALLGLQCRHLTPLQPEPLPQSAA